ncbi:DsbA family protein [Elioraea tepidiphila]|uniref:DsbA family protein n=1 Tax=Elioraea tepidiphila TaxID=457934 RepID=UPI002FD9F331
MFDRRNLLGFVAATATVTALPARAQTLPPIEAMLAERALGRADAPVTVIEYFSLTCVHCAAFHRETLPRVKSDLIDSGKVRLVQNDFPLDQPGLLGSMIARALPPDRHAAFIDMLFRTQAQWARQGFVDEIAKIAALAGMSRETFDAAMRNEALQRGVLEIRLRGEQQHQVNATPTFIFNNRVPGVSGAIPFDRFAREAGVSA